MFEIEKYLDYLKVIKKHSDNTISSTKIDLCDFYEFNRQRIEITKDSISEYLNNLYEKKQSKSTISRKLSSLRMFYDYLVKQNKVKFNYFRSVKNPKKEQHLPKFVKEIDIDKIFEVISGEEPLAQRNSLIIHLLYSTGLRVSELVNIKRSDININDHTIRVLGKGSKERVVVFGVNTKDILLDYLESGYKLLNIHSNDFLILNKNGSKLSDRYVRNILNDVILRASVNMHVSPHMLRHTFATSMLNNGADLVTVKDLLGHASLNTTSIYTHVTNEMLMKVYNNAHPRAK